MSIARDRANRSGSDPLQIDNTKLVTDSGDLKVQDVSGNEKKLIADEIHVGTGADKVILKRDSSTGKVAIQTQASGEAAEGGTVASTTVYATTALLPTSPTDGQQALVTANNFLYIAKSNGWYKIAEITNTTPSITSAGNASYTFLTDGTPVSIEITATDAEVGTALQYKYAVTSGSIGSTATVTSSATSGGTYSALAANTLTPNKFFKVTPSTNNAYAGAFSLTFSASDGVAVATSSASSFTLAFDVSGSFQFDGNGDAITVPASSDFQLGTGDFTIEAWVYSTTYSNYPYIIDLRASGGSPTSQAAPLIYINNDNTIRYYVNGSAQISTSYAPYQNKWTHVAVDKNSGTTTLYLDGVSKGTWSDSTNYNTNSEAMIGMRSGTASQSLDGYISNVRIVKGSNAYSPTALSGFSGSILFAGGVVTTSSTSSDFTMGTGDFTIETWFKYTGPSALSSNHYLFDLGTSNDIRITFGGGAINVDDGGQVFSYTNIDDYTSQWYHLAYTRTGGISSLYLDGQLKASIGNSNYNHSTNTFTLANYGGGGNYKWTGYLSDFRIVKGKAVYTGNFTRPTGPLTTTGGTYPSSTNIVNPTASETVLLLGNNASSITDVSSGSHTMSVSGSASANSDVPTGNSFILPTSGLSAITNTKLLALTESTPNNVTNGSTYISSTSRRLTMSSSDFTIGTDDFTLETWVKWANLPGSSGQGNYMFDFGANGLVMQFNGSASLGFWASGLGYLQGSVSISEGVWYHIAWTRSSGTATCYLNGVQVVSGAFAKDVSGTSGLTINGYGGGGSYGQGGVTYSGTRFVRGHVVYTGAFSPPTGPLTKTGGTYPNNTNRTDPTASQTKLLTNQSSSGSVPTDNSDSGHTISVSSGSVTLGAGIEGAPTDLSSSSHTLSLVGDTTHSYATPYEQGTGGSVYFDGTGDYLLTATNSDLVIGSNDFTAECWIYPTSFAAVQGVIDRRRSGDAANYDWTTYLNTDNTLNFYQSGGTRITSSALTTNTWYHTAVVKNSGVTTLYVDGVSQGTWNDSATYPSNQMTFGAYGPSLASLWYSGYISNVRLVVGTAVYTSNFTVPTSKLTAVTNTKLLTCNDSNIINDASTSKHIITVNGDAIATRYIPF